MSEKVQIAPKLDFLMLNIDQHDDHFRLNCFSLPVATNRPKLVNDASQYIAIALCESVNQFSYDRWKRASIDDSSIERMNALRGLTRPQAT